MAQTGKGDGGAMLIIAFVVYMTFMTYLMFAVYGDSIPQISFTHFDMPGWLTVITGAWLAWVFEATANFFFLLTFTITGHGIPVWMNAFFTIPLVFGVGFTILELIRG